MEQGGGIATPLLHLGTLFVDYPAQRSCMALRVLEAPLSPNEAVGKQNKFEA